jgi:hypothetical protein
MVNNNNKKKNKATEDELGELHKLVAVMLKERLKSEECTPNDLKLAMQFLKDNKIEVDMEALRGNEDMLQPDDLPFDLPENDTFMLNQYRQ